MSPAPLRHPLLTRIGVEHGFGVRGSEAPPGLVRPRQVHGRAVAIARPGASAQPAEADAIATDAPGTAVGIVTADCVPILLAADSGSAVAAVHALCLAYAPSSLHRRYTYHFPSFLRWV